MLAIKNNLMAESAARHLGQSYDNLSTSVTRLSSGLRINSAKDDAAGMAVRELIRADVATLQQGSRNARDAISMLQTAEGGLSVADDILVRMAELAEQASTESYSDAQRKIMSQEFQQLIAEIDRIAENTTFNGLKLLDSTTETFNIHLGTPNTIDIGTHDMTASGLGIGGVKSTAVLSPGVSSIADPINLSVGGNLVISFTPSTGQQTVSVSFGTTGNWTLEDIADAINEQSRHTSGEEYDMAHIHYDETTATYTVRIIALWGADDNDISLSFTGGGNTAFSSGGWDVIEGEGTKISIDDVTSAFEARNAVSRAINTKDEYRAKLGYLMNRLESATSIIDIQAENLLAAESRISDVDVATEMAAMTRNQVLAQAGISMLSQANSMPQMALTLLQG